MEYTLLCHRCTPEDVRDFINSRPGAHVQWRDDDWRVSYGFGPEVYLDIMFLANRNTDPEWSYNLGLLRRLVDESPVTKEQRMKLSTMIDQLKFELTIVSEPKIDSLDDPRMQAIREYLNDFGTLLWTESGIYDSDFHPIILEG